MRRGKADDPGCSASTDQVVGSDLGDQDPDTGDAALHNAITNQQRDILRWLSEPIFPVNLLNHLKRAPLYLAARSRDPDLTEMLL